MPTARFLAKRSERAFNRALDYALGYTPALKGLEYIRRQGRPL